VPAPDVEIAIAGAGPAGLAVAGALAARGVRATLFERDEPAASWRRHYARLHLHTMRSLSGLPGRRMPRAYGRYVAREDYVRYLDEYREHHRLDVRSATAVERVSRADAGYRLKLAGGSLTARAVVIATGYNHTPVVPTWPGAEEFGGTIVHAAHYRDATPFRDADVLVAGAGNSGAEIATDLAEGGARSVRIAIRTPPHIVPREVLGVPAQMLGLALERLPSLAGDTVAGLLARIVIGDLRRHGLPRPADGVFSRHRARRAVPVLDAGFARALGAGRIVVVAAVGSLGARGAVLVDGTRVGVDAIVAATGYGAGLERLAGALGVLGPEGLPLVAGAAQAGGLPGLHFIGYTNPLGGNLHRIARDARAIAAALTSR